ncbi:MAG: hypothetical protein WCA32_05735 [Chromatiaceae bacterium]
MILKAIIDDQEYTLNVPDAVVDQGEEIFAKLDRDMDNGWQMSREWVQNPDRLQRCQIAADKLLTALENQNHKTGVLMAGYILSRLPEVDAVEIDIHGEIQNTTFTFRDTPQRADAPRAEAPMPKGLSKLAAMEQAGNDVTKVFKVGKGYRFSVFDHGTGEWKDSAVIGDKDEAERLRQEVFRDRFETLQRSPH